MSNCSCNEYALGACGTGNSCGDVPGSIICPPHKPPCPPPPGCDPCKQPNRTANYGLPLWKASDVTSWLMQMNGAMMKIDEIMHQLALRTGIDGIPNDVVETVATLQQDVCRLKNTMCEIQTSVSNNNLQVANAMTALTNVQQDLSSLQLNFANIDTRMVTAETRIGQLQTDMRVVKQNTSTVSSTVEAMNQTLADMLNTVNQMQAQFNVLGTSVQANTEDLQEINKYKTSKYFQREITKMYLIDTAATELNIAGYVTADKAITPLSTGLQRVSRLYGPLFIASINPFTANVAGIKSALNNISGSLKGILFECDKAIPALDNAYVLSQNSDIMKIVNSSTFAETAIGYGTMHVSAAEVSLFNNLPNKENFFYMDFGVRYPEKDQAITNLSGASGGALYSPQRLLLSKDTSAMALLPDGDMADWEVPE